MSRYIQSQRALRAALDASHVSAALNTLNQHGFEAENWDDLLSHRTALSARLAEGQLQGVLLGEVEYNNSTSSGRDVAAEPQYPVPILGVQTISLNSSAVPTEEGPYEGLGRVTYPSRYIDIRLHSSPGRLETAVVFVNPDEPAVAVHQDHLTNVFSAKELSGEHWEFGSSILPFVEKELGPQVVEPLSEEACTALASAINLATKNLHTYYVFQ